MDLFLSLFILLILITIVLSFSSLAPWVPIRKRDLPRVKQLADLKKGQVFYDLGCGDGRAVQYIVHHTEARAIGIELAFPLIVISLIRSLLRPNKRAIYLWKNALSHSLRDADVIFLFGMPNSLKNKVKQKLERELKPGAKVISYCFKIEGWEPVAVDKPSEEDLSLYLYQVKA